MTFRIIAGTDRNSINQFIPKVDYLWNLSFDNGSVAVKSQSLQCNLFDRPDNDLTSKIREHNGFNVYCDDDAGSIVIYALSTPNSYGVGAQNVYFAVSVKDVQQVSLEEIKSHIDSAKLN